ncbi:MAG: precorrin-3B C(17)-methyltransferase, partial [Magnetococcales bacterium]|nr:precorrin-3B C(17)-methyltransferase [Magnetococcales bacterium]
ECERHDPAITWMESPVADHVETILAAHDPVVFFAALGATVRLIAPFLRSKRDDPAVLAVDEGHRYVLPVVSGHYGGSNQWAKELAELLSATAVITTASDVSGGLPVDILGRAWGFRVQGDAATLTRLAGDMVARLPLALVQDSGSRAWRREFVPFPEHVETVPHWEQADPERHRGLLWISRAPVPERMQTLWEGRLLVYRPPRGQGEPLAVGLGCDAGTSAATVRAALHQVLQNSFLNVEDIAVLATIDCKRHEEGLLALARTLHRKLVFYSAADLAAIEVPNPSATVARHVGTPTVAEAAAIRVAGGSQEDLVVTKQGFRGEDGKHCTVAVARLTTAVAQRYGGEAPRGVLFLVGIGPGDHGQMTQQALAVLKDCDCIVGYKTYIRLLGRLTQGKEIVGSAMRQELDRCMEACRRAAMGQRVAMVSSGDVGVYGMAGPALEMLFASGLQDRVRVEIVPGITALISAAARLGAPLTHDFAAISLSDLLTPWEVIASRLDAAAKGDFVTALYNPRSGRRTTQIERARAIFLSCRPARTPVALVTACYRDQERVVLTDLEGMMQHDIGMQTTVLIGNRSTFMRDGWMVTPRGYADKYDLNVHVRRVEDQLGEHSPFVRDRSGSG